MFANRISSSTSCSIWLPETSPDRPAVRSGRLKPRRPAPLGTSSVTLFKVATLPNIRLIDTPGFVGRLEMTAQPLLQFGTVTLNPTPDRRVIHLQTALGEQLFDIAERQRVAKIPAHGTQNQLRCRLPPLEDCRSGCVLHGLFRLPAPPAKVATHPFWPLFAFGAHRRGSGFRATSHL